MAQALTPFPAPQPLRDAPIRACVTCHHVQAGTCSLPLNDLDCGADRPKWREAAWLVVARAMAPRASGA